jgi:WD40 repeat protein
VVTASGDKTARVWNAQSGAVIAVLSGHTGLIFNASFSADGMRMVTASADPHGAGLGPVCLYLLRAPRCSGSTDTENGRSRPTKIGRSTCD